MILILSEEKDISTNHIIDWIRRNNVTFLRVNQEDEVKMVNFNLNEFTLLINKKKIISHEIIAFWYRRGELVIPNHIPDLMMNVKNHINTEIRDLLIMIYKKLTLVNKTIGSIFKSSVNKLSVLSTANELGLKIPKTLITTQRKDLEDFIGTHRAIITKAICTQLLFLYEKYRISSYTEDVTEKNFEKIPNTFPPSLFQQKITKKYELRIFYLKGEFYPMAIFSQLDEQTATDFRKYNHQKPNRNVPFILPYEIQMKLKLLMDAFQLDTGSIDMVVDKNNDYYFLEVNPIGQFGMTSHPCNYYLEKRIAEHLI
jgi:ATP-GRASP peptide maturase of grasp-with-spasm system